MRDLHRDGEYAQQGARGDGGEDVPLVMQCLGGRQQGVYLCLCWQCISMDEMQNTPGVSKATVNQL